MGSDSDPEAQDAEEPPETDTDPIPDSSLMGSDSDLESESRRFGGVGPRVLFQTDTDADLREAEDTEEPLPAAKPAPSGASGASRRSCSPSHAASAMGPAPKRQRCDSWGWRIKPVPKRLMRQRAMNLSPKQEASEPAPVPAPEPRQAGSAIQTGIQWPQWPLEQDWTPSKIGTALALNPEQDGAMDLDPEQDWHCGAWHCTRCDRPSGRERSRAPADEAAKPKPRVRGESPPAGARVEMQSRDDTQGDARRDVPGGDTAPSTPVPVHDGYGDADADPDAAAADADAHAEHGNVSADLPDPQMTRALELNRRIGRGKASQKSMESMLVSSDDESSDSSDTSSSHWGTEACPGPARLACAASRRRLDQLRGPQPTPTGVTPVTPTGQTPCRASQEDLDATTLRFARAMPNRLWDDDLERVLREFRADRHSHPLRIPQPLWGWLQQPPPPFRIYLGNLISTGDFDIGTHFLVLLSVRDVITASQVCHELIGMHNMWILSFRRRTT